jgi:alcohol dehydrogenase (cytochrome c)
MPPRLGKRGGNASMRTAVAAGALAFAIALPLPALAQSAPIDAEAVFKAHCAQCHEPAINRAPSRDELHSKTVQDVFEALTSGVMQPMAASLSADEKGALASFLGGRTDERVIAFVPRGTYDEAKPAEIESAPADVVKAIFAKFRTVTPAMLNKPPAADWLLTLRSYDANNFSPLKGINRKNVAQLSEAWRAPLQSGPSMPEPIVHDGVMYLQTSPDVVLALNAATGELLWRHVYKPEGWSSQKMGLALHGDKLYVPTSDLHVIALDARTGAQLWDHAIDILPPAKKRSEFNLRSAPLIVGDKLIQGVTGAGAAGGAFIVGLDLATGKEVWRFNTIPRPGEPGGNSWNGLPIEARTGGSVWDQGSYDKELGLVYFGVSQTYDTAPLLKRSPDPKVTNDALYTDSTLALDPNTGKLAWYYQHVSNDQWDLDWVFERTLTTMKVGGKKHRVVMTIGKMGLLDALDAKTGEYLFSIDAGTQNVISAIDPKTGKKTIDPSKIPDITRPMLICPAVNGARAWPSTSLNARTGKLFVPITEICQTYGDKGSKLLSAPGASSVSADHPDAVKDGMMGRIQAMDLGTHGRGWNHDVAAPVSTAVLATSGGVVFAGDLDPALKAFDDRDGKLLWTGKLDNFPSSSVITYKVGKVQYVAVVQGLRNGHVGALIPRYDAFRKERGEPPISPTGAPAIVVFALGEGKR